MKLLPFSDLHKETMRNKRGLVMEPDQHTINQLRATEADVVVAAGDVDTKGRSVQAVAEVADGRPAVLVAGNHEFYGGEYGHCLKRLEREVEKFPNVHFLHDSAVEINGVVFVGSTLWTDCKLFQEGPHKGLYDFQESINDVGAGMNDYRRVKWMGRPMRVADTMYLHSRAIKKLRELFDEHRGKKMVVVTHHAPSFQSVNESYHQDIMSAAYASNLEGLVEESGAAVWVHGHMHDVLDYQLGNTRVVCNCRGYADEVLGRFNPQLIVEV